MNRNNSDSTAISAIARLDQLPRLMEELARRAENLGIAPELALRLQLIVEELFTNTSKYGTADGTTPQAAVLIERVGAGCHLCYRDGGIPFDPFGTAPGSALTGDIGGLGTALVRGLASEHAYMRQNGMNVINIALMPDA